MSRPDRYYIPRDMRDLKDAAKMYGTIMYVIVVGLLFLGGQLVAGLVGHVLTGSAPERRSPAPPATTVTRTTVVPQTPPEATILGRSRDRYGFTEDHWGTS